MAIKNSQSKRMALANMLKQRPIYNQRMANFMSPTGALGGLPSLTNPGNVPQNTGINQLLRPAQSSLSNIYNPSVQPTGPTGLTSNFYDPSYGIDRGFADQMTARNKAMQGMDSGQIQYDPVNKSFFSVGAMGQRGGPALQGTYDQMYRKYDVQNQLRGLGTPSSLTPMQQAEVAQAGTNPFNAAQIDFMNKNQDVFTPRADKGASKLQLASDQPATTQTNYAAPTSSLSGQQGVGLAALGSQAMPTQSTALGQLPKTPSYAAPTANTSFNNQSPVNMTQPQSNNYQAQGTAGMSQLQSSGQSVPGYPQQIGNQRSAAPRAKTASRGKLSQLMPPPGG